MATVQAPTNNSGVPWRSRLQGPSYFRRQSAQPRVRNQYIRTSTRTPTGTRTVTTHYEAPSAAQQRRQQRSIGQYNPANIGASGSVGMLEAEFLICLALLVLLMFANSASSYGEKIMSLMKRGSLVCLLFFLLAIISQTGQNAERIAKAFGALVIVAILITTPINTVFTDVDAIIKNDWVGTTETGGDTAASADAGTQTGAQASAIQAAEAEVNALGLPGQLTALLPQGVIEGIGSAADKGASWLGNFLKGFSL